MHTVGPYRTKFSAKLIKFAESRTLCALESPLKTYLWVESEMTFNAKELMK